MKNTSGFICFSSTYLFIYQICQFCLFTEFCVLKKQIIHNTAVRNDFSVWQTFEQSFSSAKIQ